MTTYTRRENARRAALKAGIAKEMIAITVHKKGDIVRFGWKTKTPKSPQATGTLFELSQSSKIERLERNGIRRPSPGGLCAQVWSYLDTNPLTTRKELRAIAVSMDWNLNNASCELYAWRRFHRFTKGDSGKIIP